MSAMFAFVLLQAAATAPVTAPPKPFEGNRIVCRTTQGTGSRLNTTRVCLPKREWQRMWDESRATTSTIQDNHSKRMPGQ